LHFNDDNLNDGINYNSVDYLGDYLKEGINDNPRA
jgi:hypothetical protein